MKKLHLFLASAVFSTASFADIGAWSGINNLVVITKANTTVSIYNRAGDLLGESQSNNYGRVWFKMPNSQELTIKADGESKVFQHRVRTDIAR